MEKPVTRDAAAQGTCPCTGAAARFLDFVQLRDCQNSGAARDPARKLRSRQQHRTSSSARAEWPEQRAEAQAASELFESIGVACTP